MKLVIVGGVAGGASAAARARRLSEQAEIVLLERGPEVSFANCGLPYYIGGEIPLREKLLITTPQRMRERFNLDVRTGASVEAIDRRAKTVRVREVATGREYHEIYDKLILAPGAAPVRPSFSGSDLPGVLTLRTLADADRVREAAQGNVTKAVLLGAGLINLEVAEALIRRGIKTTIVEKSDQILPAFDKEMTAPFLESLKAKGVSLRLGQSIESITDSDGELRVQLTSGETLDAQLAIIGVGVRPESRLAVDCGLSVGQARGILVNEFLQTDDPDIYAVGDAIVVKDVVTHASIQAPLAGPANRQGRIAADNVFGRGVRFRGTQGTAIVGFFDKSAAITGPNEKALRRQSIAYRKVYVHPLHHAGYYPGAEQMALKLLFEPGGKILGAQATGGAGVDKRIDVIAAAIQAKMTVFDLEEMELAYAPQFGSAKDPVNMAGFVAAGLVRGEHPQVDHETAIAASQDAAALLLDVRTTDEYAGGAFPGAINIPVDQLRARLGELPTGQRIFAYCQVGQRGYIATRILLQSGFDAYNVSGGMKTRKLWEAVAS
jgi:NADPH-dependent 2,4-dienoyl-CoA reductase/sulfur reductase-like enzyme/rhodanese-related sulfurtransferase